VVARGGKAARTRWRVRERLHGAALLEVTLDTGRTHQIRVHLAHLGCPVVGDPVYGGRARVGLSRTAGERSLRAEVLDGLKRQALHAAWLEFPHPVTGEELCFRSQPPADFDRAYRALRPPAGERTC